MHQRTCPVTKTPVVLPRNIVEAPRLKGHRSQMGKSIAHHSVSSDG
jgi:hypothetical protein